MITEECNPHLIFTVVDSLRREVDLLTQRVDLLEHSSGGATGRWELLSLGHYPLVRYPNPDRLLQADNGPPEVTQEILALAATLPLAEDVAIQRVIRAFDAGFWARAAIETQTQYWGTHLVPEADEVFFVYRVNTQVSYLVYSKEEVRRLSSTAGGEAVPVIAQGFSSIIEIKIFCAGGNFKVPDTYKWRNLPSRSPPTATRGY